MLTIQAVNGVEMNNKFEFLLILETIMLMGLMILAGLNNHLSYEIGFAILILIKVVELGTIDW